jgi:hypothetical protein
MLVRRIMLGAVRNGAHRSQRGSPLKKKTAFPYVLSYRAAAASSLLRQQYVRSLGTY